LDVSVAMYAAGKDHPYKDACTARMTDIADGRLRVAIDSETIQEVLYRFGRLQRWDTGTAMAESLLQLAAIVLPVTAADARLSVELFGRYGPKGVSARDLLHCALARNNGLDTILSTDRHFDLVEGVLRWDPVELPPHSQLGREPPVR
jgi:predicted nucleic acid-binding protein